MDYYKKVSCAAIDLQDYVGDDNRRSWSGFVRLMLTKYGFGNRRMRSLLQEQFPALSVKGDVLVRLVKNGD